MFYFVENMTILLIPGLSNAQPNRAYFYFGIPFFAIPFVYCKLAKFLNTDKH
jgi:hypothetical protein